MKKLLLSLSLIFPLVVIAQNNWQASLNEGISLYRDSLDFKHAVQKLETALLLTQNEGIMARDEVNLWLVKAQKSRLLTLNDQMLLADSLRKEAQRKRQRTDSLFKVTRNALSRVYFYEGKFGLAAKEGGRNILYGFVDKKGNVLVDFAWDEARPFSAEDGFARVGRNSYERNTKKWYLLDTLGKEYLLAQGIRQLTKTHKALELLDAEHGKGSKGKKAFSKLEIIISQGENAKAILKKIPKENKVRHMSLKYAELKKMPSQLEKCPDMQVLNLKGNRLESLQGIEVLTSLKQVNLSTNALKTPDGIEFLVDLQELDLSWNVLQDLSGVERLTKLTSLNLTRNRIRSLKAIEGLFRLQSLDLTTNQLTSFSGLEKLDELSSLKMGSNKVKSLEGIEKLDHLRLLDLAGNQITSTEGIETLVQLSVLNLSNNSLTEIKGLEKLTELTSLNLSGNKLTNLEGIEKLKKLKYLNLLGNKLPPKEVNRIKAALPLCEVSWWL